MDEDINCKHEEIHNGHRIIYYLKFHRLDLIRRTFFRHASKTGCRVTDTEWQMALKCEREAENDFYTYSVKIKRLDESHRGVKGSVAMHFFAVEGVPVYPPILSVQEKMASKDELEAKLNDIDSSDLREMVFIRIVVKIERCHIGADMGTDWRCASKNEVDEKSVNLSKL
ncbi:unnamed protein product [Larinioides sclopetarius]|uniref:Uncharacterized protein n=1 Tax=Larinioides sclopetarius TaxID=280406 RepID=A0AAV1ZB36_9ARAC